MGYFLTISPANAPRAKSLVSPKTHTPGSRLQERGHRFYSASLSRWISRDPIGENGGRNINSFVADPIGAVDYLGLYYEIYSDGKLVSSVSDIKVEYNTTVNSGEFWSEWGGLTVLGGKSTSGKRIVCAAAVKVGITINSSTPDSMSKVPSALKKIAYRKHLKGSDGKAKAGGFDATDKVLYHSIFLPIVLEHERAHAQAFITAVSAQAKVFTGFVTSTGSDAGDLKKVWEFIADGSAYDVASGDAANKASITEASAYYGSDRGAVKLDGVDYDSSWVVP